MVLTFAMEPVAFEEIGKGQLSLPIKKGFSVSYKDSTMELVLNTDDQLQQPSMNGKFKMPPGTVECIVPPSGKSFDIKLLPDLSAHGAKLSIYPLKNGNFDFSIAKSCQKCGTSGEFTYNSEKNQVTGKFEPSVAFKGFKVSSTINYLGKSEECYPLHGKLRFDYKNLGLRFCYCTDKKELRCGLFTNLNVANVGATAMIHQKAVKEVKLFAMACVKNVKMSFIGQVLGGKKFEARTCAPFQLAAVKGTVSCLATVTEKDGKWEPTSTIGTEIICKAMKTKILAKSNGQISATCEREIYAGARLLIGANVPKVTADIKAIKPEYQVGLLLSQ